MIFTLKDDNRMLSTKEIIEGNVDIPKSTHFMVGKQKDQSHEYSNCR